MHVLATPPFTLPPPPCASHRCSIPCLSPSYIPTQVGNSPIYPTTTSLFSYPQGQGYSPSISLLPCPKPSIYPPPPPCPPYHCSELLGSLVLSLGTGLVYPYFLVQNLAFTTHQLLVLLNIVLIFLGTLSYP